MDSFLTKRDEWSGKFSHLFEILDEPSNQGPMHLPDAPNPGVWGELMMEKKLKKMLGVDEDEDDNDDDDDDDDNDDDDDDCDQPSRRQRRSIRLVEKIFHKMHDMNVTHPELSRCAHDLPHWKTKCSNVSRKQASDYLEKLTGLHIEKQRRKKL